MFDSKNFWLISSSTSPLSARNWSLSNCSKVLKFSNINSWLIKTYSLIFLKLFKEKDFFLCFPWSQHDIETRGLYTKKIFNFYDKIFPGITVYKRGMVYVEDLALIRKGVALSHYGQERKYWMRLQVRNKFKKYIFRSGHRHPVQLYT